MNSFPQIPPFSSDELLKFNEQMTIYVTLRNKGLTDVASHNAVVDECEKTLKLLDDVIFTTSESNGQKGYIAIRVKLGELLEYHRRSRLEFIKKNEANEHKQ